jgi:hypothetical protein
MEGEGCMSSDKDPVECPQVIGKTIQALRIFRDPTDGTEIQIDFVDGTSLSCCVVSRQTTEASLMILGGAGEPEVLHRLPLD